VRLVCEEGKSVFFSGSAGTGAHAAGCLASGRPLAGLLRRRARAAGAGRVR